MSEALAAGRTGLDPVVVDPLGFDAIPRVQADVDPFDVGPSLPTDHPSWQQDIVSISSRARALLAVLRPLVVKVLSFWDHRLGDITLAGRAFGVDPSGSYRFR